MSAPAYRTFLGQRVWPGSFLKVYYPFFISGSLAFFLFSFAHTKMMNNPTDKWMNIVKDVQDATEKQKLRNEATQWFERQLEAEAASGHAAGVAAAQTLPPQPAHH
ncbi:hypothetical protein SeMB42_g04069 [Synchytrium endobioticum]|uniref:Uncharacterized protein n=1 Tax=Synchytrium endobioticum TaxID=286115 RepID=A0A507D1D1_9FUNG|nr:hypothetical protein SeMB42_g04069 [Synchytrium endobioticum]TPX46208.1 hypothetical protein SeLEV6574_g03340 [Synchytrium endobioticum]